MTSAEAIVKSRDTLVLMHGQNEWWC